MVEEELVTSTEEELPMSTEKELVVSKKIRDLKKGIAVFDNKFINAFYRMTLTQKRLLNMAVAAVNAKQILPKGKRVVVSIDDFAQLSGLSTQSAVYRCREAAADLISVRVVDIEYVDPNVMLRVNAKSAGHKEVKRISHLNFFQEVEVLDTESSKVITFMFSDWVIPYIAKLDGNFTKVHLEHVNPLTSFYSMRLYESVVLQMPDAAGVHCRLMKLSELRDIFGLTDEKYKRWVDFKKRCIVSSVDELHEKTPFDWRFETIGKGRYLQGVLFSATPCKQKEFIFDGELKLPGIHCDE